ncbi:MAG: HK97 family phage prohead protease, partial [Alphaproteobacteria bacterium]|nr:HK97 family phage prohead protease [Alphaproteobacteria bacterium]
MKTSYLTTAFEVKELSTSGVIGGYASVFGEVDAQRDIVAKGAFTGSLAKYQHSKSAPAMLWMHDTAEPIGVWMKLREDARGLYVEGQLAVKTQDGADAYELLKIGAVNGLSIGYTTIKSTIDSKTKIRTLTQVELFEISLVTFPANALARVHTVKTISHDDLQAIVGCLK